VQNVCVALAEEFPPLSHFLVVTRNREEQKGSAATGALKLLFVSDYLVSALAQARVATKPRGHETIKALLISKTLHVEY
jgi:hypothetical protein